MTRIRFEDLPSTNTPRNATNLNKLNNVVISSTEPNTGEEVWFQKGNNIDKKIYTKNNNDVYEEFCQEVKADTFKNDEVVVGSIRSKNMFGNYTIINGWIDNGIARIYTSSTERIAFVDCKPNTTYTISKTPVSSRFRVGNYTTIPTMTATATDYTIGTIIKNDSGTKITYTTNATAKYLLIQYSQTNEDSANLIQQILNTMQVEEGSEASNYMPYQQIGTVIENFADKVTFASGEEAAASLFRKIGNQIIIMYQGPNKTHSGETLLFTLPEAYRPKSLIVAPYTKWASAYGQVIIYDNGQCKIGNISSTSATGRVAFNVTYTTD